MDPMNPAVSVFAPKPRLTPVMASELKRSQPTASLQQLIQLAVTQYDCSPEEPVYGIGFRDKLFNVLGPYCVHITDGPVHPEHIVAGRHRVFPINPLFREQLAYCLAYEYLYPSLDPVLAKYSKATLREFLDSVQ